MKSVVFAASLGLLSISACVSAALEEADTRKDVDRSSWALGRYELVSFNGQSLPVELSEGRTLSGGYLILRGEEEGVGPVSFEINFADPDPKWWRSYYHSGYLSVRGSVWADQEPVEGVRNHLRFEAKVDRGEDYVWWFHLFDEFPLEWAGPKFASGTLFGNELRVGHGEKLLVFMKR